MKYANPAVSSSQPINNTRFVVMVDVLVYASLFWRNYSLASQKLICPLHQFCGEAHQSSQFIPKPATPTEADTA